MDVRRVVVPFVLFPVVGLLVLAASLGADVLVSALETGVAWALALAIAAGGGLAIANRHRTGAITLTIAMVAWLAWVFVIPDTTAPPAFAWYLLGVAAAIEWIPSRKERA